jgi:tripartite-type tricarboxylate transporter receptor subunit TctC
MPLKTARDTRLTMRCMIVVAAMVAAHTAGAQTWKPQKNVEIVSSAGAGGSADRGARVVQKYLQAIPGMPPIRRR